MVNIGANIGDFKQGTSEVKGTLRSLASDVAAISVTAFAGITAAMLPVSAYALKLSSNMQQAKISMETMLGSAEKADSMIGDLWKFAAETPFEFSDLQMATKRMLAFGFAAEDIIPDLTAIGDAAAGLGVGSEGVNRITLALGQMKAKSKVSGDEMLQMTEAGIPALDILSKSIGKSTAEVMDLAEKGVIPADQAIQALLAGMEERFPHMMDKQSKSMAGMFSTLKDNISTVLIEVAKPAVAWLTDVGLPKLIEMTTNFSNTMKNGGSLTEAFNSMFSGGFDGVLSQMGTVGEYLQKLGNAIAWVKDNANLLVPVLIELVSAFIALKIIQSVLGPLEAFVVIGIVVVSVISAMAAAAGNMAAVAAIAPIFAGLITVLSGLATASLVIGGVVLAIGALAAAAYLIYDNWGPIKSWFINLWNDIVIFVADNINVMIALFPVLGLAAYVIYEYWGVAVDLANSIMNSLVEFVTWAKDSIINEFNYYAKMWDDFVAWAVQGIANFKAELSNLVSSFMPAWAGSMLGGIQSLGEKLSAKTAEIGNAMRRNLTVNTPAPEIGPMNGPENNPDLVPVVPAQVAPATFKPADWSKIDFTGGKDGKKKGKSDEEKEAEKAEKAWEQLQKKAEQTSDSIKKEWISLTGTQIDALENWKSDELKTLDESVAANENYQRDLDRLNEIYAAKKKKILADEQKDTNRIWDSARADAEEYQNKLAEIGITGADKQKLDIDQGASAEIDKMLNKYRDLKAEYVNGTKEQQEQFRNAWTANGIQFEITENGMVNFQNQTAANQVIIEKEKNQKIQDLHYERTKWQEQIDKAYADGDLASYQQLLNDKQSLLAQDLAGQQAMADLYKTVWTDAHMSMASVMANVGDTAYSGFKSGIADVLKGTSSIGEAWSALGGTIGSVIADMAAKWIAAQIAMAIFGKGKEAATGATAAAGGAAVATAWAPAAAMVSLATFGANAGPAMGGIALTTGLAAVLAGAGGAATGGHITGKGTGTSDDILTWLSNGEYVIKASAVKALGLDALDTLNTGNMPAYATGGLVTGRSLLSVSGNYNKSSTISNQEYSKANISDKGNQQQPVINQISIQAWDQKSVAQWLENGGGTTLAKHFRSRARSFEPIMGV